jgi:4-alpha-glucanotransferase
MCIFYTDLPKGLFLSTKRIAKMKIHFFLRFQTSYGQQLGISGNIPALGNGVLNEASGMSYYNDQFWHFSLDLSNAEFVPTHIQYSYILFQEGQEPVQEWGNDRIIEVNKITAEEIQVIDTWNHAGEFDNVFFSAPFQKVLLPSAAHAHKPKPYRGHTHVLKVKAPLLHKDEQLCICGISEILGGWDASKSVLMNKEGDWWVVKLNLSREDFPMTYKYGVWNHTENRFVVFETGSNRILYETRGKKKVTILHDGFAHLPNTSWKGAGIAIPVFSLRTRQSFGIGEFTDIRQLVDWCKMLGFKMVQILPVNDTITTRTWEDSYPYSAISAFALHPIFLNLEKVAGKDFSASIRSLHKKQKQLNELPEVDFEAVLKTKWNVIEDLFILLKERVFATEDYRKFFEQNRYWLQPYAAFSYLRDKHKTAEFTTWKHHAVFDAEAIEKFCSPSQKHFDKIAIHYFTQYHLHLQLKDAHEYANKHGIILKGDIPIGINRYGVDAWMEPELYNMDMQSGAPPDDFAVRGQNWGFPTYNWTRMQEDGFSWWRKRFEQMSRYFDAFRIDHILGFFRIWSIPYDAVEGIMGHFVPAIPVDQNEFAERGIPFSYQRFCQPYITDAVLWELFGPFEKNLRPFLEQVYQGHFQLLEAYNTQRKVETWFSAKEKSDVNDRLKQGLFDLLSNVILFPDKTLDGKFHFRFNMESTSSFRHLQTEMKEPLKSLYINYFFRRQDEFWRREAMKKLPALKRTTDMLICGEDLGMVPDCVPDVMKQLGILSLEIQRMPKDPKKEFFHPNDAPYLSVVTPSTHDMSTIREWWEESRDRIQNFYTHELGQYGQVPYFCEPWISKALILQHLYSPAQWSVFQFQDLMGMSPDLRRENPLEERINVPANPKHYWRYRMHLPLETLIRENSFNEEVRQQVLDSGRL